MELTFECQNSISLSESIDDHEINTDNDILDQSVGSSGEKDEGFSKVDGLWECNICEKTFTRKNHMKCHVQMHRPSEIPCPQCNHILGNKNSLRRHLRNSHTSDKFTCEWCGKKSV